MAALRPTRRGVLAGGLASLLPGRVSAQPFPSRPIRLLVPFPAGGPTDVCARLCAEGLAAFLKVGVVVENRPGAAASLAAMDVVRAEPDGHTLLFGTTTTHALYPWTAHPATYDPLADFLNLGLFGAAPVVCTAHPSLPPDLAVVLDPARTRERPLRCGVPPRGAVLQLATEYLRLEAGGPEFLQVPYPGNAPALNDLLGGHLDMVVDTLGTSLEHHRDGRLRILAIAAPQRSALLPDVPTVDEALHRQGFAARLWNVVAAPARLPGPAASLLQEAMAAVARDDVLTGKLGKLGIEPTPPLSQADLRSFVSSEQARWRKVIAASGK